MKLIKNPSIFYFTLLYSFLGCFVQFYFYKLYNLESNMIFWIKSSTLVVYFICFFLKFNSDKFKIKLYLYTSFLFLFLTFIPPIINQTPIYKILAVNYLYIFSLFSLLMATYHLNNKIDIKKLPASFVLMFVFLPLLFFILIILPSIHNLAIVISCVIFLCLLMAFYILFEQALQNKQSKNVLNFRILPMAIGLNSGLYTYYFFVEQDATVYYFLIITEQFYNFCLCYVFLKESWTNIS